MKQRAPSLCASKHPVKHCSHLMRTQYAPVRPVKYAFKYVIDTRTFYENLCEHVCATSV